MDREKAIRISEKLKACFIQISKEEDIQMEIRNISISSTDFNAKISAVDKNNPLVETNNLMMSKRFGFKHNIIGLEFSTGGKVYTVTGFKLANRKYPIIALCTTDGRSYKFSSTTVLKCFGGHSLVNRSASLRTLLD